MADSAKHEHHRIDSDGRPGEAGGLRLEKKVVTGGPLVVLAGNEPAVWGS